MKSLTLEMYRKALELREQLQKTFPKCFFPFGQEKPLKVGILQDLFSIAEGRLSPCPDKKLIRLLMNLYTSSISYRAALISPNAVRIDLEGKECSQVTSKERYKAKTTTRHIRWALDTEGFEAEQAKLKEQSKKAKDVASPNAAMAVKKNSSDADSNKALSNNQTIKKDPNNPKLVATSTKA